MTRKKWHSRSVENNSKGDSPEFETEPIETSDATQSDDEMVITSSVIDGSSKPLDTSGNILDTYSDGEMDVTSPFTSRSVGVPKLFVESPLPISFPGLSSTVIEEDTDDEAEIVSTETRDEHITSWKEDSISSPSVTNSSQQGKSMATPRVAQRVRPDVSQPLLCRLTEELSQGKVGNVGSLVSEKTEQVVDVLDTRNCCSDGNNFMTVSPGEGSMENLSPNIPQETPKTPVKGIKVLSDSLVNVENGLVLEKSSPNCRPTVGKNVEAGPTKRSLSCKRMVNSGQLSSGKTRQVSELSHADNSSSQNTPIVSGKTTPSQDSFSLQTSNTGDVVSENIAKNDTSQDMDIASIEPTKLGDKCSKNGDASHNRSDTGKSGSEVTSCVSTESGPEMPKDSVKKGVARKRKKNEQEREPGFDAKIHEDDVDALSKLQPGKPECVLLIPSNMEQFQVQETQVVQVAVKMLKVAADHVFVWQNITLRSLPSQHLLFFMLDMVKELQQANSEGVLDLLFDGDCFSSRLNNYLVTEAQVFGTVNDKKAQQDIQSAMWSSLERSVGSLPMLKLIHVNKDLAVIAFDMRTFDLGPQVFAYMQAYKGLFRWGQGMEAVAFPLSPSKQRMALQAEALALKVWLTKINPITDVVILPSDDLLLEKNKCPAHEEFFKLSDYLREKTQPPIVVEDAAGTPVHRFLVPLLVFQPVQVFMLSFQEYFQSACEKFFQTRGIVSGLALVPLSNLFCSGYDSISSMLNFGTEAKDTCTVSVYSSFCPTVHPTTMVLLEISYQPQLGSMPQTGESPDQSSTERLKRKRGRPKKFLPD